MRPLGLTLQDFYSYQGEHRVELDGVNLAVFSGPNGSGKSTLAVKAARYALFGATDSGADSPINDQANVCRVGLEFALGDQPYLVSRQRSRKGGGRTTLSFQLLDGDSPTVLDGANIGETQARIEKTLGMTDELFCSTACATQGDAARFSEARPAQRKEVLAEILGLDQWEILAQMARRMGRELAAQNEATEQRIERAKAIAADAQDIRERLALVDIKAESARAEVAEKQLMRTDAQETKDALVRDRAADEARRRELRELGERAEAAQAHAETQAAKLKALEDSVAGKDEAVKQRDAAQAAHARAEELEEKRQEHERLGHDVELAQGRQGTAIAEHGAKLEALRQRITAAHEAHDAEYAGLLQRKTDLDTQAEPLERVPCAGSALEGKCPLIEAARGAKAKLPAVKDKLAEMLDADPAPDEAAELARLEGQDVGEEEAASILALQQEQDGLGYHKAEHEKAKAEAQRLPHLQQRVADITAAERQVVEAQEALDLAKADAQRLADNKRDLERELGPERDWDTELRTIGESIAGLQAAIAEAQERVQSLTAQRGGLEERLRAAEAAAAEADELAGELRKAEKRVRLLRILAEAFGKAGIPALLIERAVPELEAQANDVLRTLSDGSMAVALESQRETAAKTVVETLDIVVSSPEGPRPYETFSGGERMRVDLAIRIGLAMLLANRRGVPVEWLVLDEAAAPLDANGRELFVECVEKISPQFGAVFVISHVESLQDAFPYQFRTSKDGDGSHVELVAG